MRKPTPETFHKLWARTLPRAAMIRLGLLAAAVVVAALLAGLLGIGMSAMEVLVLYVGAETLFSAWHNRKPPDVPDEEARALEAFALEPLGGLVGDAREQLMQARRGVGREATMYRPLDRLVRVTRKLERRLALEPALRPELNRTLTRELPLVATTATQYVRLRDEPLSPAQSEKLLSAEGVLREAADRLEGLSGLNARPDGPVIGVVRLDANAEVLADYMAADMKAVTGKAVELRGVHALEMAAKNAAPEMAEAMRAAARVIEADAGSAAPALLGFAADTLPALLRDAGDESGDAALLAALRGLTDEQARAGTA